MQQNISSEQLELAALRRELDELKQLVAGTPPLPVADATHPPGRRRAIHETSTVGWARRVLRTAGYPMHIDEIVSMIAHMSGEAPSKATLVSNLCRYVKAGDTFRRTAANTFELIPDEEKPEIRLVG